MHAGMDPLTLLFHTFTAYQRTGALRAAVELDVFTAIAEGADTVPALARRTNAAVRGIRGLADALTALGFLEKHGDRYALPPDLAPLLDGRSPACMAGAIRFLASDRLQAGFASLTAAVRRGGTALEAGDATEPDNPIWVEFARAMAPIARLSAQLLANLLEADAGRPWRVLDVAASHGLFGITLAERNPRAEITALDWASVLAVAAENARAAGVASRFRTLPGSAFEVDLGTGWDLVLLTNLLHHFDAPTCETLLRRLHGALTPGGRVVTLEFVPDESRTTPLEAAAFTLTMLALTPGGDVYTFAEYERMFRNAGFARSEFHALPPSVQQVVISYRS